MPIENAKTVDRAARLLFELADHPAGRSATELAARLDTQRPPLYRLLQTLTEYRLIQRDEHKRYTLGIGVLELARAVQAPLEAVARPVLQRAADTTGAAAMLALVQGDALVTAVSAAPAATVMQISAPVGFRHPSASEAPEGAPWLAMRAAGPRRDGEPAAVSAARAARFAVSRGIAFPGRTFAAAAIGAEPLGCVVLATVDEVEDAAFGAVAAHAAAAIAAGLGHRAR